MTCPPWLLDCNLFQCSTDIGHWSNYNCPIAYSQSLNTSDGQFEYSEASLGVTQVYVDTLFSTFLIDHTFTDDISNPRYSPFQTQIRDLCIDPSLPGVCGTALEKLCSNYSRTQIEGSSILSDLCGCYTPPNTQITQYTLGSTPCLTGDEPCVGCIPGQIGCVSLPQCDPLCRRSSTSQKANPPTGNFITCPVSICAIDNVTVNSDVTFNQVCSGCGAGGCICVISGINTDEVAANVGLGINFDQYCGSNSVCINNGVAGNCNVPDPEDLPLPSFSSFPSWGILAIVGISLLILGIALFV